MEISTIRWVMMGKGVIAMTLTKRQEV